MKNNLILAALMICLSSAASSAQTLASPPPKSESQQKSDDDIVRITTNLIQVDASVTDKNGKPVPNLRAEDFEVLVNGRPQKITNFLFVGSDTAVAPSAGTTGVKADKSKPAETTVPPLPTAQLRPEQVRRSIALVVDDLIMSPSSMSYVRRALKNFVDVQMEPGDLVALVRVGKGSGVLQRFTADKRELYSVIEKLRYNLLADRATSALTHDEGIEVSSPLNEEGPGIQKSGQDKAFVTNALTHSTISATNYVVKGMMELPGRKAVLLISEGFPLYIKNNPQYGQAIREAIKRLVDAAARSGVVISTMNPVGLETYLASDVIGIRTTSEQIANAAHGQFVAKTSVNDGLIYLAKQTGGLAIYNSNDLKAGIRDVLDDLRSYYLIGFQPEAGLLDQAHGRFNQLKVEVKVSGVKVRYRSGFFGIKDRINQPVARTAEHQIVRALASPFGSTDINIRLTPLFTYDPKAGALVRSLVHISADNLTFVSQPNGMRQAVINILASTFDNGGAIVDSVGETHSLSLTDEWYRRGLTSGFVYSVTVPLKRTGDYQLRVAVQDAKSLKTGTASQFITIPDVKKGRLALSGIALSSYDPRSAEKTTTNQTVKTETAGADVLSKASARRFRAVEIMQFAYSIYNAALDKTSSQPHLTTRVKLFRDGKEIYASSEAPFVPTGEPSRQGMLAQDSLRLDGLAAGDHVLQVIVFDISGRTKYKTATNWIDFEVVK